MTQMPCFLAQYMFGLDPQLCCDHALALVQGVRACWLVAPRATSEVCMDQDVCQKYVGRVCVLDM